MARTFLSRSRMTVNGTRVEGPQIVMRHDALTKVTDRRAAVLDTASRKPGAILPILQVARPAWGS